MRSAGARVASRAAAACLGVALGVAPSPAQAAGASLDAATPEQSATASEKYRAGTEAFEAQKYDEALARFRESYDVVASPNSHLMIARTLAKMGKSAEAFAELDATVREADAAAQKSDKYKKTAQTARAELAELRGKVGTVVVTIPATVTVGGRPLPTALGGSVIVDPGANDVVLRLPSGAEQRVRVDVKPGQETHVDVAPPGPVTTATPATAPCPPPAPAPRPGVDPRALAIISGGVGLVGFGAFTVFGLLDRSQFSDLQHGCPSDVCPASRAGDAETGRTYQTLANVGLGVGIFGAATALVFVAIGSSHANAHAETAPRLAIGPGSMTLRERF
jgi:hypothetical protein